MTSEESGRATKQPVGECDEHGIVTGDDVEYAFPNPARCAICGRKLERCTVADAEEVKQLAQ